MNKIDYKFVEEIVADAARNVTLQKRIKGVCEKLRKMAASRGKGLLYKAAELIEKELEDTAHAPATDVGVGT